MRENDKFIKVYVITIFVWYESKNHNIKSTLFFYEQIESTSFFVSSISRIQSSDGFNFISRPLVYVRYIKIKSHNVWFLA